MLLRTQCSLFLGCILAHAWSTTAQTTTLRPDPNNTCEHRIINYIDPVLPPLCHKDIGAAAGTLHSSPPKPTLSTPEISVSTTEVAASEPSANSTPGDHGYLARTFISFDDWKDQQAREASQEVPHDQIEHEARGYNPSGHDNVASDGSSAHSEDDSETVGTTATGNSGGESSDEKQQDSATYDREKGHQSRSKDAGKTCKERFSYSSFDAGATVLKTNEGAKNAKAILVENKDSYMLLECAAANKFVIVELTDDILIDTVVLANFEFFSSMIRHFRVSVSGRYPVKLDKWTSLGTFEAKNSRDIQAFLIPNPHIWAKYVRIEFLSHYGNEYYCPVSLLRVHGTRMLDSWTENEAATEDEEHDQSQIEGGTTTLGIADNDGGEAGQGSNDDTPAFSNGTTPFLGPDNPSASAALIWLWSRPATETCANVKAVEHSRLLPVSDPSSSGSPSRAADGSTQGENSTDNEAEGNSSALPIASAPARESSEFQTHTSQTVSAPASTVVVVDKERPQRVASVTESIRSSSMASPNRASSQGPSIAKARNATSSSPSPPSPTVQESFHKAVSKRLQLLETNVTLSLRYLEDQSRILQESQHMSERTQLARVDSFIENLNRTLMSDLAGIRQQYDQVWQSTVIALESQKEQSQRELLALSSRLNILADEVVFQKRMAILQAVLLLCCLILVVFSRVPMAQASAMPPLSFVPRPYVRARAALRAGERLDRQAEGFSGHYQRVPKHSTPPSNAPFTHRGDWASQGYSQATQDGLGAIYEDGPITPPSESTTIRSSNFKAEASLLSPVELDTREGDALLPSGLSLAPGGQHRERMPLPHDLVLNCECPSDFCVHGDGGGSERETSPPLQSTHVCQPEESP
ncbi:UNC-like C-terminal-domain-containing protein [Plectosphaerella cucumerina]|uniref:UNC-like C-terminal-domain-containing protein n=1 Tax=Plectosphaerella cucumerina TaxID=40658 RepID=A0A8K0T5T3_9PEZI|nr:UNC-like C-terminal-domain-containing protein [Plectosphaerella cucumerina]